MSHVVIDTYDKCMYYIYIHTQLFGKVRYKLNMIKYYFISKLIGNWDKSKNQKQKSTS